MTLFLMVTDDEYELPLAVADSAAELARITGKRENTIYSAICHAKKGDRKSIYHKIEIMDED